MTISSTGRLPHGPTTGEILGPWVEDSVSLSLSPSLSLIFFNSRIYKVMYIHFLPLKLLQSVRADFNELNYFIDYD